jgi:hypothetical protein
MVLNQKYESFPAIRMLGIWNHTSVVIEKRCRGLFEVDFLLGPRRRTAAGEGD